MQSMHRRPSLAAEVPIHSEFSSILLGGPEQAQRRLLKEMNSLTMTEQYNGHNNRWCCGDELLPAAAAASMESIVRRVPPQQQRSKRNPLAMSNLSHENRAAFYIQNVVE